VLSGPVLDLERCILDAMPSIEHWFRNQWQKNALPFYCSVDLRNSGFKLAPVEAAQELEKARSPRAR
jgi:glutamate--cysteine ligase